MFRYISEDIVFWLIKNDVVEIDERDIYIYGLETFLLNVVTIITALVISILTRSAGHFIAFLTVFVPLRTFAGGFHAKTSTSCYIFTTLLYGFTVLLIKLCPLLYQNPMVKILFVIVIITIIGLSPQNNNNHILNQKAILRNKIAAIVLIVLDSLTFIMLHNLHNAMASSMILFIAVVSVMLIFEKSTKHNA